MKKKLLNITVFFCGLGLIISKLAIGQAEVMFNGAYMVMNNGTQATPIYLVVGNSTNSGIQNLKAGTSAGEGGIISESEFNQVLWNVGASNSGTYTIPFSTTSTHGLYYIPLKFTITGAGAAHGATGGLSFSTWGGENFASEYQNSTYMPTQVLNMDNFNTGLNDDPYVVDRFWIIDGSNLTNPNYYTTPPTATMTFTYLDAAGGANSSETTAAGDLLTETNLIPQRWNSTLAKWGDWLGTATINTGTPYANVGQASNINYYAAAGGFRAWTLSDKTHPLPIQLTSFTAQCQNYSAILQWTTATETNNDYFTIDRTTDGINFTTVAVVKGSGTTSTSHTYSAIDESPLPGISYYRISQTDLNGVTTNLNTIVYTACENNQSINAFTIDNNSTIDVQINSLASDNCTFRLVNMLGQIVMTEDKALSEGLNDFKLNPNVVHGVYILQIVGTDKLYSKKLYLGAL